MPSNLSLMRPEDCVLVLADLQAGPAFGVGSEDRQVLLNNAVALARAARLFGIPIVASTSASKVYSGPMMPAVARKAAGRCRGHGDFTIGATELSPFHLPIGRRPLEDVTLDTPAFVLSKACGVNVRLRYQTSNAS